LLALVAQEAELLATEAIPQVKHHQQVQTLQAEQAEHIILIMPRHLAVAEPRQMEQPYLVLLD
jgi:hypothetical protein